MAELDEMKRLMAVLSLRAQNAQAILVAIQSREAQLRAALSQLLSPPSHNAANHGGAPQGLMQGEVEARWRQWAEARRASLQTELALVLSQRAEVRKSLATAIGKEAALSALIDKEESVRKRAQW